MLCRRLSHKRPYTCSETTRWTNGQSRTPIAAHTPGSQSTAATLRPPAFATYGRWEQDATAGAMVQAVHPPSCSRLEMADRGSVAAAKPWAQDTVQRLFFGHICLRFVSLCRRECHSCEGRKEVCCRIQSVENHGSLVPPLEEMLEARKVKRVTNRLHAVTVDYRGDLFDSFFFFFEALYMRLEHVDTELAQTILALDRGERPVNNNLAAPVSAAYDSVFPWLANRKRVCRNTSVFLFDVESFARCPESLLKHSAIVFLSLLNCYPLPLSVLHASLFSDGTCFPCLLHYILPFLLNHIIEYDHILDVLKLWAGRPTRSWTMTMTMTMTHSKKSRIHRMKAWPYRQECRDHGPTKKNLFYW